MRCRACRFFGRVAALFRPPRRTTLHTPPSPSLPKMFLARKITRPKWDQQETVDAGEIASDTVTADLRTTGNTLSFWTCDVVDDVQLKDVALALAANGDRIDKIDIAWLTDQNVSADGLQVASTNGKTPVLRLAKRHVDIVRLDLVRLGKVARLIQTAVTAGGHRRLTKAEVQQVLIAAVEHGDLQLGDIHKDLRAELEKAIQKASEKKDKPK